MDTRFSGMFSWFVASLLVVGSIAVTACGGAQAAGGPANATSGPGGSATATGGAASATGGTVAPATSASLTGIPHP
jgi:hypothetical protein